MKAFKINFINKSSQESALHFGGDLIGINYNGWPKSKTTGNPMKFYGSIPIPQNPNKVLHIFMTDEEEYVDGTWEADGGENCVLIGSIKKKQIESKNLESYKSQTIDIFPYALEVFEDNYDEPYTGSKIGGFPAFIQEEEYPSGGNWQFIMQIDSQDIPFIINFGDSGTAYIFVNKSWESAKMLWQCY
jgi:hypothetical protein